MGDCDATVVKVISAVCMAVVLASCASVPVATSNRWKSFPNGVMREEITCPSGMRKVVSAATSLGLFAGLWKDQPEPGSKKDIQWAAFNNRAQPRDSVGESGRVLVYLLIGKHGQVMASHVVCSSNKVLDAIALRAAESDQYQPARIAGVPVMSMIKRPYNFFVR